MYKVDQLSAMKWCKEAWDGVSPQAIANCFGHTKLVKTSHSAEIEQSMDAELCSLLSTLALSSNSDECEEWDIHEPSLDTDFITTPQEPVIKKDKFCLKQTLLTNYFK